MDGESFEMKMAFSNVDLALDSRFKVKLNLILLK